VLALAALAVLIFGVSTAGKTLEQIAAEELGAGGPQRQPRPAAAHGRGA
jgi:hypothetical protein